MKKKLTEKDKKDWNNFLQSKSKVFNKDVIGKESLDYAIKLKTIDLHGYSLENANKTIKEFIKNCSKNNVIKINVITGKGLRSNIMNDPYLSKDFSILKYSVPDFIKKDEELMSLIKEIKVSEKDIGGTGVFSIFLKKFIK